jgi:hypothetical protein
MSIESYYHRPPMLSRLREGTLGCYIDLFAEQLQREGHCQQGAWRNLRVVSDFSHWLARRHLDVGDISEQTVGAYDNRAGSFAHVPQFALIKGPDYAECGSCDVTQNDTLSPIGHGGDTQFGIVRDSA